MQTITTRRTTWTSSAGWTDSLHALGNAALLPVENILAAVLDTTGRWLPGQLLDAIARGGNTTASFAAALTTTAPYIAAVGIVAFTVFARRDITA